MSITTAIDMFEGISLAQMDGVKLMNRTDRKFWFNISHLESLLSDIKDDYYALEVNGEKNLPYSTTYYDTSDNQMYLNHHRGKLNRFKIRRRNYVATESSFLEIKFKSNKGRTIKERIPSMYNSSNFNENEGVFIHNKSPYEGYKLQKVLVNGFKRLMLVSKQMNERCTIDQELAFVSNGVQIKLEQLVIVEVKTEGYSKSRIIDSLNNRRLKASGFSKYCIGRSITDNSLKINSFKFKHRQIEKHIKTPISQLINLI
ncbi:MAG: polyphosphate polymerase domain-containing protein [Rikenellaceae bacterium]